MVNENLAKLRAYVVFGLVVLGYPALIFLALLYWLYTLLIGLRSKCTSIAGEVAVVTGAAHGLGREIAIELARRGCHVAIVDVNMPLAKQTALLISERYNVKAKAYEVDVSDFEQVVALNEKVTDDLGTTSVLVNNAGVLQFSKFLEPDWRDVQRMINVNLTAHFWMNRVFLPKIKERKRGHVVAISSIAGMFPLLFHAEYTSTKYAVRGMMRVLRQELKLDHYHDITTTTVCPAFLYTNEGVVNMCDKADVNMFYPLIRGDEAARRVVLGMLRGESEVVMPGFASAVYRMVEILPIAWQDWMLVVPLGSTFRKSREFLIADNNNS